MQAHELIDQLPENASRYDVVCRLDLRGHIAAEEPSAAATTIERLLARTRQLPLHPRSGRVVPDYGQRPPPRPESREGHADPD